MWHDAHRSVGLAKGATSILLVADFLRRPRWNFSVLFPLLKWRWMRYKRWYSWQQWRQPRYSSETLKRFRILWTTIGTAIEGVTDGIQSHATLDEKSAETSATVLAMTRNVTARRRQKTESEVWSESTVILFYTAMQPIVSQALSVLSVSTRPLIHFCVNQTAIEQQ